MIFQNFSLIKCNNYETIREEKYNKYALVREMMETPEIINSFKPEAAAKFAEAVREAQRIISYRRGQQQDFSCQKSNLCIS